MLPNLSELLEVALVYVDGKFQKYTIHKDDLAKFIEASVMLHHSPGINPHNGGKAKELWFIKAAPFEKAGPFWWTTPGLQENFNPAGVSVYQADAEMVGKVVWRIPGASQKE